MRCLPAIQDLPAIFRHQAAVIAKPPVLPASAIDTTPSFRYMVGIREASPFYPRTPPSVVQYIKNHVNVSHDKSPFVSSSLSKISDTLHPLYCSCSRFTPLPRLRLNKAYSTLARNNSTTIRSSTFLCQNVSPKDDSLIEPAYKAGWAFCQAQVTQAAVDMKRVEIVFHHWAHRKPSARTAS